MKTRLWVLVQKLYPRKISSPHTVFSRELEKRTRRLAVVAPGQPRLMPSISVFLKQDGCSALIMSIMMTCDSVRLDELLLTSDVRAADCSV